MESKHIQDEDLEHTDSVNNDIYAIILTDTNIEHWTSRNPKRKIAKLKSKVYEASIYYLRVDPPDPKFEHYTRLDDIYHKTIDVEEMFKFVKEEIFNPRDKTWEKVLNEFFIPYKSLQWEIPLFNNQKGKYGIYRCNSKPFLKSKDKEKWIIRIDIFPPEKETAPPGVY